jgi:choline dehydrogenase-like flavoprotein
MNCLRTPEWVRSEWEEEFGLEGLGASEFDRHLDAVWARLNVTDECSDFNGPHQRLKEACEKLGYDFRRVTRNVDPARHEPDRAGYLGFGDQSGSKLSTPKTYLADARARGARFVVDCRAERVLVEDGRAAGVEAVYRGPDGHRARVLVRAPQVVAAGGSMETPALLLRSAIGGPAVGNYLRLQPATVMYGFYEEPQNWWWGPPQAGLSLEFANVEEGYGFLLESPHATTGTTASRLPWQSGLQHKTLMSKFAHIAPFVCLIRDRGHGRVSIDRRGNAVHHYRLTDDLDVRNFHRGLGELARLHETAGALEIVSLGRKLPSWKRGQSLDKFADLLRNTSLAPNEFAVLSGHQMGSCRMGRDPATSVAGPWGELHDVAGVWVGDASAFPSAPGTNPMITAMALAHRTAEAMAAA